MMPSKYVQTWKLLRRENRVTWLLQAALCIFAIAAAIRLWLHAPDGSSALLAVFFVVGLLLSTSDGVRRHMMYWVVLDYFREAERRGCAEEFGSRLAAWIGVSSSAWSRANFSGLNELLSNAEKARAAVVRP